MSNIHAPSLNAQNLPWFNVQKPLDLPDLKGKLVILDFWTFCCINCIHIIPTLKKIEAQFPDSLVVIGVHSPKFPGEKVTDNVSRAISRYEIQHPVVHDTDFSIWQRYAVRAWPTLIFISPDGYVLGQLPGEPDPQLLKTTIGQLLEDYKNKGLLTHDAQNLLKESDPASEGTLRFPGKIVYSTADDAFAIADSNHNQIVTADREGRIQHRIGCGAVGRKDGSLDEAEFFRPQGLCYRKGIIWVADTENHLLRKIDLANRQVTTVAGTGTQGSFLQGQGMADQMALSSPWDVSVQDDDLYFANAGTHQIGILHIQKGIVGNFAGTGQEALVDGPRLQAALAQPSGLTLGDNKLFFADSEISAIRSIQLDSGGMITTYVGTGLFDFGDRDGVGKDAILQHPLGVHYSEGKVYIADSYNHKIRSLDLEFKAVNTVRASTEIVCDDKSCTRLWEPAGVILVDKALYVSDTNNHRILKIDLETEKTQIFLT